MYVFSIMPQMPKGKSALVSLSREEKKMIEKSNNIGSEIVCMGDTIL